MHRQLCRCRKPGPISPTPARCVAIGTIIIAAADEAFLDSHPGIAAAAAPQARPERGRARVVGERCQTDKTAAQEAARCKAGASRGSSCAETCCFAQATRFANNPAGGET